VAQCREQAVSVAVLLAYLSLVFRTPPLGPSSVFGTEAR
jgi:hypothetical protein